MKKFILIAILAITGIAAAVAQPRAIGANLGYGVDISYQHTVGQSNVIDLSLNFPGFAGIGASATYDWLNPFGAVIPWDYEGQWNWYMGVGAGLGTHRFKSLYTGVVGHVGISYDFWFPLQLSVDWRPNIGINWVPNTPIHFNEQGLYGFSLGVRYLF